MDPFEQREKSFEAKYQLDQELAFRVRVRRDKLLGQWAASRMNLEPAQAELYVAGIAASSVTDRQNHDSRILVRLWDDLAAHGVAVSREELLREFTRLAQIAHDAVMEDLPHSLEERRSHPS